MNFKHLFFASCFLSVTLGASASDAKQKEAFKTAYTNYQASLQSESFKETLAYAEEAWKLGTQIYGEDSDNVVNLTYNLALAYSNNRQGLKAFKMLGDVVEAYEASYGEYDAHTFKAMTDRISATHTMSHSQLSNYKVSIKRLVSKAHDIADSLIKNQDASPANVYYTLAKAVNNGSLSSVIFSRAHEINQQAEQYLLEELGDNSNRTLEVRFMLAKYADAKKNRNSAIDYYEKVVSTVNKAIDTSHPFELASHAALVELYERKGESDKATAHCVAIGQMTPWEEDIDPTPLFRADPVYPKNLAKRSAEGWVDLSFTISEYGFVTNIKVLDTSHAGFRKTSIKALEKWRYAPKVVDGETVAADNQKVRLSYKLG